MFNGGSCISFTFYLIDTTIYVLNSLSIVEVALVWGVAISHCKVKVKLNYENDPDELP